MLILRGASCAPSAVYRPLDGRRENEEGGPLQCGVALFARATSTSRWERHAVMCMRCWDFVQGVSLNVNANVNVQWCFVNGQ